MFLFCKYFPILSYWRIPVNLNTTTINTWVWIDIWLLLALISNYFLYYYSLPQPSILCISCCRLCLWILLLVVQSYHTLNKILKKSSHIIIFIIDKRCQSFFIVFWTVPIYSKILYQKCLHLSIRLHCLKTCGHN